MAAHVPSRWGVPLLAFLLVAALPLGAETILVVPFDNASRGPEFDWLGESFAEALNARFSGNGLQVVAREERLQALERLGLPPGAPLTRASLLRLAEEAGADWLVTGRFEVQDQALRAQAEFAQLGRLSLSPPVEQEGRLEGLLDLQGELAWRLLRHLDPGFPLSRNAFLSRSPRISASAFENYVRGLLAVSRQQQRRYFLQANRLEPAYAAPVFRLGLLYFEDMDYSVAARWLTRVPDSGVPDDDPMSLQARFYLSLCHYYLGDYDQAADSLAPLAQRLSVASVWNNLGIFSSRQADPSAVGYFERALEADPAELDALFNLGLYYFRASDWPRAAETLAGLLELHPGEMQARALLVTAYERLGRAADAERLHREAGEEFTPLEPDADALDLDRLSLQPSPRSPTPAPAASSARSAHVVVHVQRAEDALARGALEDAQEELLEAILLDPASHRAHLLLAEVYNRRGRTNDAIAELKASLWSKDSVTARLRLAELYLAQGRAEDAREEIAAVFALDPANAAARALEKRLPPPAGSEGRRP